MKYFVSKFYNENDWNYEWHTIKMAFAKQMRFSMHTMFNILITMVMMFLISCSSHSKIMDTDVTSPDSDAIKEDVEFSDVDNDNALEEQMNTDIDIIECPPLKKAKMPYYGKDGKITFCRPCDTPTDGDPQCISNLWQEDLSNLVKNYPKYGCEPVPCKIAGMQPATVAEMDAFTNKYSLPLMVVDSQCDVFLSPMDWSIQPSRTGGNTYMNNGKVALQLLPVELINSTPYYFSADRSFLYDIEKKTYLSYEGTSGGLERSYNGSGVLETVYDIRGGMDTNSAQYLTYFTDNGKHREVVYNEAVVISYPSAQSQKWAFANISTANEQFSMRYSEIGKYDWHRLDAGLGFLPEMSGDWLVVFPEKSDDGLGTYKPYLCDLSKNPYSLDQCLDIQNNANRMVFKAIFDRKNSNIMMMTVKDPKSKIIKADLSAGIDAIKYEDVVDSFSEYSTAGGYNLVVEQLEGNILMYKELAQYRFNDGFKYSVNLCFMNLDTKEHFCMKPTGREEIFDGHLLMTTGDGSFWKNWVLYGYKDSTDGILLRDMQCYCEKEGVCPFDSTGSKLAIKQKDSIAGLIFGVKKIFSNVTRFFGVPKKTD